MKLSHLLCILAHSAVSVKQGSSSPSSTLTHSACLWLYSSYMVLTISSTGLYQCQMPSLVYLSFRTHFFPNIHALTPPNHKCSHSDCTGKQPPLLSEHKSVYKLLWNPESTNAPVIFSPISRPAEKLAQC